MQIRQVRAPIQIVLAWRGGGGGGDKGEMGSRPSIELNHSSPGELEV